MGNIAPGAEFFVFFVSFVVALFFYFAARGRRRTLRKATGPWSVCSRHGAFATSFVTQAAPVGDFTSTSSWITCPLNTTFTNRALATFLPLASKRGALKTMSRVCHSPGFFAALTRGGVPLSR